jgi:hypothetical protein
MHTFSILFFRNVPLVGKFEALKPANQGHNNTMETSTIAVATFQI